MPGTTFSLFAYGTLKRGFANHDRYCRDATEVVDASVRGWLYDLPFGFPAVVVPPETIHTTGTADHAGDAEVQRRFSGALSGPPPDTPVVFGELLTFDDPRYRLPALDRLEGFEPGSFSLYRRVLVPARTSRGTVPAWLYAIREPSGAHLPGGRWPA